MQLNLQKAFLSKHKSSRTLLLKHNHYATSKPTSNPLQCNEREPSFHTAGTGNLASKKFANRQDKCVLVYVFL